MSGASHKEVPLDSTPVIQAIAGQAMQGGVSSTFFIGNLVGWSFVALLSLTPGWLMACGAGFGLSIGVAKLLTAWDPHFFEVLLRHMFQAPFYPARKDVNAPSRRVRRRKSYLK